MSTASILTDKYVSVEHLVKDSGANTEGYVADLGLAAVPVNIQPSSKEVIALNGGMFGKSYTIFTTASGILETDRLTVVSGTYSTQYLVKGHEDYGYFDASHYELYVEKVLT